ncbi:tight adherence pilus pseudopilin TadF [Photobacterium sp. MCCC 1A19761]|uniref:tight adherence pilus pseudopilin TadF n=1 Tax=Photobacterium sp. MCCC 1A19761 TaxID=3115000 RepID=UPI00307DE4A5
MTRHLNGLRHCHSYHQRHSYRPRHSQRGSSVIAFPVIALVLTLLLLFVVQLGYALSLKSKLDRVAYALATVVTSEQLEVPLAGAHDEITAAMTSDLQRVAQRYFATNESAGLQVSLLLEQIKFDERGDVQLYREKHAGLACQAQQALPQLSMLSPEGGASGANLGEKADLFQVSVCLSAIPMLMSDIFPGLKGLGQNYFTSSAVMIGRQYAP